MTLPDPSQPGPNQPAASEPDPSAVRARVASIVSSVTRVPVDPAGPASRVTIEEWDSLSHVEILFAIEEDQGVEFGEDVMDQLDSVDAITSEVVRLQLAGQGSRGMGS